MNKEVIITAIVHSQIATSDWRNQILLDSDTGTVVTHEAKGFGTPESARADLVKTLNSPLALLASISWPLASDLDLKRQAYQGLASVLDTHTADIHSWIAAQARVDAVGTLTWWFARCPPSGLFYFLPYVLDEGQGLGPDPEVDLLSLIPF